MRVWVGFGLGVVQQPPTIVATLEHSLRAAKGLDHHGAVLQKWTEKGYSGLDRSDRCSILDHMSGIQVRLRR